MTTQLLSLVQRLLKGCPAFLTAKAASPGFADPAGLLLTVESSSAWQTHLEKYLAAFAPANYPETEAVQLIASITWRLSRLTAMETNLLNLGKPVPEVLYQAMAALQNGYQIAIDGMVKLPGLTKLPPADNGKVIIMVKPADSRRPAAPAQGVAPR